MPICKGCGAQIRWATTLAGRKIPLDWPSKKMVMILEDLPEGTVSNFQPDRAVVVDVYMPHHATCPKADQFRRKP